MSDNSNSTDEHSNPEQENPVSAVQNADAAPEQTQTDPPQKNTDDSKPNAVASILLKVWSAIMIFCTAILSVYVFILKDDSAAPYFVLGLFGLCIPPIVSSIKSAHRKREIQRELDERIRKAEIERIRQAREREKERLKQEEIFAQKEVEEQHAIGDIDVEAFKVKNSS